MQCWNRTQFLVKGDYWQTLIVSNELQKRKPSGSTARVSQRQLQLQERPAPLDPADLMCSSSDLLSWFNPIPSIPNFKSNPLVVVCSTWCAHFAEENVAFEISCFEQLQLPALWKVSCELVGTSINFPAFFRNTPARWLRWAEPGAGIGVTAWWWWRWLTLWARWRTSWSTRPAGPWPGRSTLGTLPASLPTRATRLQTALPSKSKQSASHRIALGIIQGLASSTR